MPQRNHPRYSRHFQVRFRRSGGSKVYSGFSTNISRTGMFLKTNFPCRPGTRLQLEIDDPDQGLMVEGEVVHSARIEPTLERIRDSGMGIRFLPVDELIGRLVPQTMTAIGDHSQPRQGVFTVRLESRRQLEELLHGDLADGGMFVPTDEMAALNQQVTIELHLPGGGGETMYLPARVVRRFEPGATGVPLRLAGMGVAFFDPKGVRDRLLPYVHQH